MFFSTFKFLNHSTTVNLHGFVIKSYLNYGRLLKTSIVA